eukprot:s5452_g1.t1
MLDTAIWTFSRALLCIPRQGEQNISGVACCALTGLLPPDVMLQRARLLYLRQLVANAPFALWAAECSEAARTCPVQLDCPRLWRPFPVVQSWMEALGFVCDESGMRSP